MSTDRIKADCLDMIEAVGSWPVPCHLPMKRYSDEKADYDEAVLKFLENTDTYVWYEGATLATIRTAPSGHVVSRHQIEQLIDEGWMVDP